MKRPDRQVIASSRGWLAVVLALIVLPPGAGQAQETPAPERWTGCWDVEWGEWSPPLPEHDSLAYLPPPRIELTDVSGSSRGEGEDRVYRHRSAPGSLPSPHALTHWGPVSEDSIRIVWSTGHIGTAGRFEERGDTLHGRLQTFTDVIPHEKHRTKARLLRVSCSAPPEFPASAQRAVLRSVPLSGGDTVTLGEPLPDGRIERFNVTAYLLEGSPTGLFEGARDVRVRVTRDGRAADIRLSFEAAAVSLDSLVAAFRDSLGSPSRPDRHSGETNVRWENRTTRFRLRSTGSDLYAYLTDPRLNWAMPAEHPREGRADTAESQRPPTTCRGS